ncbi:uncharacterized protein LOC124162831 [Ischnura elegans]|uniref:uncharacterized protein LOC124162831 n=1 Tax=Ischnura elegans TaxID=197161 RepID=UPI001ED890C4|nr:uncharacterized protein LOC124162831 [Ischnura elegans]XP_046395455.1 uncharacterized protein LOC124162831 [Ischnura elegans]
MTADQNATQAHKGRKMKVQARLVDAIGGAKPAEMLPLEWVKPPPEALAIDGATIAVVLQLVALVAFLFLIIVFSEVPVRIAEASRYFHRYRKQRKTNDQHSEEMKDEIKAPANDVKESEDEVPRPNFAPAFLAVWFQYYLTIRSKFLAAVEGKSFNKQRVSLNESS